VGAAATGGGAALIVIKYYSRTQFYLIIGPLVLSFLVIVAVALAMGISQQPFSKKDVESIVAPLIIPSVLWLAVGQVLTNRAYERRGQRFLGIDISKNLHPSPAEQLGIKVNRAASVALGLTLCAWLAMISSTFRSDWPIFGPMILVAVYFPGRFFLTMIEMVLSGFRFRPLKG
jgi:hypothetical protein